MLLSLPMRWGMPLKPLTAIFPAGAGRLMSGGLFSELKLAGKVMARSIESPPLPPSRPPLLVAGMVVVISRQLLAVQAGSPPWLICLVVIVMPLYWLFASLWLLAWTFLRLVMLASLAFGSTLTETLSA